MKHQNDNSLDISKKIKSIKHEQFTPVLTVYKNIVTKPGVDPYLIKTPLMDNGFGSYAKINTADLFALRKIVIS